MDGSRGSFLPSLGGVLVLRVGYFPAASQSSVVVRILGNEEKTITRRVYAENN